MANVYLSGVVHGSLPLSWTQVSHLGDERLRFPAIALTVSWVQFTKQACALTTGPFLECLLLTKPLQSWIRVKSSLRLQSAHVIIKPEESLLDFELLIFTYGNTLSFGLCLEWKLSRLRKNQTYCRGRHFMFKLKLSNSAIATRDYFVTSSPVSSIVCKSQLP